MWPFERSLQGQRYASDEEMQNATHRWLQKRKRNFHRQEYLLLFKHERLSINMEHILKNIFAITNAIVL
jgi:hypothetical protein